MSTELCPPAREVALPYYEDALPTHDGSHANRVRDLSARLATHCGDTVDTKVLAGAAWLHDIGRPLERTGEIDHHDRWAAAEAAELLEAEGVAPDRIDAVERCIRSHSIRSSSPEPESMEAQLLFDADKLDALGARGLVRLSCIVGERSGRAGEKYAVIGDASALGVPSADCPDISLFREWMRERLDHLYTAPGRRIGESRWRFVNEFFEQFDRESGPDPRT